MRHNRCVKPPSRQWVVLLLATLGVVGCGELQGPATPDSRGQSLPPFAGSSAQLAWEGVLACADCEGIEVRLVLDREGVDPILGTGHSEARYELLEIFLADDGGERYREQGRWQREGRLLRLEADTGGERVFAIEPDGQLSQRDGRGGVPAGAARLLAPVTAPSR
jgi:hypothetical protein